MKNFKIIMAIIITFVIVFATSALLELDFFNSRWPRYGSVVLFMVIEFAVGFMYVKSETDKIKSE